MKTLIVILIAVLITGCNNAKKSVDSSDEGTNGGADSTGIEIYLLEDDSLAFGDIRLTDAATLILKDTAWISSEEIDHYDISTNILYLKSDKSYPEFNIHAPDGVPFVFKINSEICFVGAFWLRLSSLYAPCIKIFGPRIYPDDLILFEDYLWLYADSLTRIREQIAANYQARPSLNCILDSVTYSTTDSVLQYTYTIENLSDENLYVLDADKMGDTRFYQYGNGISVSQRDIWVSDTISYWEQEWLTRVESKKSIIRTRNYHFNHYLEPGSHEYNMRFNSIKIIPKNERILDDGIIWMGAILSNKFVLELN